MSVKAIFLDVDGTLTTYTNAIPASAIEAIKTAQAQGHKVMTVTGRSKSEMYQEILAIGFDGYIGGNGSYVEYQDQVLFEQVLSKEDSHAIVDWLKDRGLEFYLESNNGLFASDNFEDRGQPVIQAYSKRKGQEGSESLTIRQAFPEMIFDGDLYRQDLNKVSFILDCFQDYLDAKEAFPHLKVGTWGGAGEEALFGDIGVSDIDKGKAIGILLDHLGLSREDAYGFGDAKIDIPMLEYCGTGIAMGSGGPEIKAMADYVTDDVDKDGLYKAFDYLGLLGDREDK